MRKLIITVLAAVLVVPALADVYIGGQDSGSGHIRIIIHPSNGAIIRGVALKVSATGGAVIDSTTDVTATHFNTFIDYAYSNPAGYGIGIGHPIANPNAPGVAILPASTFSLSAGYLDEDGDATKGEGLVTDGFFDVYFTLSGNASISIALDTLRGGIVGDNLGTITVDSPFLFPQYFTLTTSCVPSNAGTISPPGIGTYAYPAGSIAPIGVTMNPKWYFWKWTGDNGTIANIRSPNTTIIMDANKTIIANFTFACQEHNFTKLTGAGTDNVVNIGDLNLLISYVQTNKTGTTFVVTNTNPAWSLYGPIFNLTKKMGGTDNVVNISDLNAFIDFVNKRKAGSTFVVNCATCGCG